MSEMCPEKVAVFLPHAYRGGVFRGAKNAARILKLFSRRNDWDLQVVFSYIPSDVYDVGSDFDDLRELGIELRPTTWVGVEREKVRIMQRFFHQHQALDSEFYSLPTDGCQDFFDCQYWFLVTDRLEFPLIPVRPYFLLNYDYIQRYVPGIFEYDENWLVMSKSLIPAARNAEVVFGTTDTFRQDLINYAGVRPDRICIVPSEFEPPSTPDETALPEFLPGQYFVWSSNATIHKNQLRAFKALEYYYNVAGGTLKVLMTGGDVNLFNPDHSRNVHSAYLKSVHDIIRKNKLLAKNLHIVGELPERAYAKALRDAAFFWHPVLYDNGTFCALEAAYLGTRTLSLRYPAMTEIDRRYKLDCIFFDPFDVKGMGRVLKHTEEQALRGELTFTDSFSLETVAFDQIGAILFERFWQEVRRLREMYHRKGQGNL